MWCVLDSTRLFPNDSQCASNGWPPKLTHLPQHYSRMRDLLLLLVFVNPLLPHGAAFPFNVSTAQKGDVDGSRGPTTVSIDAPSWIFIVSRLERDSSSVSFSASFCEEDRLILLDAWLKPGYSIPTSYNVDRCERQFASATSVTCDASWLDLGNRVQRTGNTANLLPIIMWVRGWTLAQESTCQVSPCSSKRRSNCQDGGLTLYSTDTVSWDNRGFLTNITSIDYKFGPVGNCLQSQTFSTWKSSAFPSLSELQAQVGNLINATRILCYSVLLQSIKDFRVS